VIFAIIAAVLFFIFIKYIFPWLLIFLFAKWMVKHKNRVDPVSMAIGAVLGYLFWKVWEKLVGKKAS
ncbi:MAG: hypothetical protein ABDI20_09160, partial [Candidatus Bipolaricaulaceae bacterium]